MSRFSYFTRLLKADLKRVTKYIPSLLISVCILFTVCASAGYVISKNLYKENKFTAVNVGYYLSPSEDSDMTELALGMLKKMESIEESASIFPVDTIEDGYRMLEQGEILFFIIVPEDFFTGLMDSTNTPLEVVVQDTSTISSYVANELFLSYANYLTTAQAAIYSVIDTLRAHEFDEDFVYQTDMKVNLVFTERVINKDSYIQTVDATGEGNGTLIQHYLSAAVMLVLLLLAVILMPFIQGHNSGVTKVLKTHKINNFHIFISNVICTIPALYISYIPCFIGLSIYNKQIFGFGLITVIPAIILLALIMNLAGIFSRHVFTGNMIVFCITLAITYIGGGFLPHAMLPSAIQKISAFLPGEYLIKLFGHSLFGL